MTAEPEVKPNGDELSDEDLELAYGSRPRARSEIVESVRKKSVFKPWHHPVKQIVRTRQWAALTHRLIQERTQASQSLRYFTLPGADLLDVRVLAEACDPLGVKIDYFGFNAGVDTNAEDGSQPSGEWTNAESALRQAGKITESSLILPDRLEDLAVGNSQAANSLRRRPTFDVINIDACNHLAYEPTGRVHNTFSALRTLLEHQMLSRTQWLLFITTRVHPDLLGDPALAFQDAIARNLEMSEGFSNTLADILNTEPNEIRTSLDAAWRNQDPNFLKLYSIGLGKFLLQFFHMQPNLQANVELASCYSYRVYGNHPDMLAIAFRITPGPTRSFDPGTGGPTPVDPLEASRAIRVLTQARKLQDLDREFANDNDLRDSALRETKTLLSSANYDVEAWTRWLSDHEQRPVDLEV